MTSLSPIGWTKKCETPLYDVLRQSQELTRPEMINTNKKDRKYSYCIGNIVFD